MTITTEDGDGSFAGSTAQFGDVKGDIVDARATDTDFTCQINWHEGPSGRYVGRFDFQGRLTGITYAVGHEEQQANWVCLDDKTFGLLQHA
ncbi:hypothetical protein ABTY96_07195 [Streptomyces sp. NPDC096057]|uniref:hypothetical protein n=1 Tax=Streptomyces sp. NPDC096057 TaxID=3155543 RepID=UPI00332ADFFA